MVNMHPYNTVMKRIAPPILAAVGWVCWLVMAAQGQYTYRTLEFPLLNAQSFNGIDGSNVVGWFTDSNSYTHGFIYNGSAWTSVDAPQSGVTSDTYAFGISGTNIVGSYWNGSWSEGFIYNGNTWTMLSNPNAAPVANKDSGTWATGISGSNVVGYYSDAGFHGFLYNGISWTTLDTPQGIGATYAEGISGANIVGYYVDTNGVSHGFLYDGSSWTTLDAPLAQVMRGVTS